MTTTISRKMTTPLDEVSLAQLAEGIKREHEAVEASIGDSLRHAKAAGEKLIEVKGQLQHGKWMPWVEAHCGVSHSTALLYMKVASNWSTFVNSQCVENLPLYKAAALLAQARNEAKRAEKQANAPEQWATDLKATMLIEAQNRLRGEVSKFWEQLDGGKLYIDMGFVLKDSQPDDYELVNIVQAFNELRHRVDRCIEALRRRMDDASVTWEKPTQTVLSVLE